MASNPRLENVAQTPSGSGFSNRSSVSSVGHMNGTPTIGSRSSPNVWNASQSGSQNGKNESTQPPASVGLQTYPTKSIESKFQHSMSSIVYSEEVQSISSSGSQNGANLCKSTDLMLHEPAPMSLPVRMGSSQSTWMVGSGTSNQAPLSVSSSQISAINGISTSAPPTYAYDLGGSNIILPRGTIKSVAKVSATDKLSSRSASTPVAIQGNSRTSSLSSPENGSSKIEKPRKSKKINSSSLPVPPPPSSIASVPVADGNIAIAELIVDRWPDALYQGWMKKRNKGKESTSKKRYLVVKTNCIEYYSDPMSTHPKGTIRLEDIAVQFNEGLRVYIKEKVWEFQAESERDLTRWHVVWRAVLTSINK